LQIKKKRPVKSDEENKQFIFKHLGTLILGYKVRRIIKNCRIVNSLKVGLIDLTNFVKTLK
jgi:hypothetical protein